MHHISSNLPGGPRNVAALLRDPMKYSTSLVIYKHNSPLGSFGEMDKDAGISVLMVSVIQEWSMRKEGWSMRNEE